MYHRRPRHRRVECVGEAVLEHPEEFRIDGSQFGLEVFYLLLDSLAAEETVFLSGTLTLDGTLRSNLILARQFGSILKGCAEGQHRDCQQHGKYYLSHRYRKNHHNGAVND